MNDAKDKRSTLLIADDDEMLCRQLSWALQDSFEIRMSHSPRQILECCAQNRPDLVLLDLNFTNAITDGKEGIELAQEIMSKHGPIKVIVMTGNQEREVAKQALHAGAHDHLLKPIDPDELTIVLKRAEFQLQLEKESHSNARSYDAVPSSSSEEGLVGWSREIKSVLATAKKVSQIDATVLITGESGTGKELIARMIHRQSPRHDQQFVAINCGAIPEALLESELFGHEKGAFTGAVSQRKGKFESGDKGTIFLDEIGELSATLQVKVLRFLQDHTIERVGGNVSLRLDVRIIAATNRKLQDEIKKSNFREDLYYRLNVIAIEVPPLRARGEDVDLLAHHFLHKFSQQYDKPIRAFSPQALKVIREYNWPGNVRELENKVCKAVVLAQHSVILPGDLALDLKTEPEKETLQSSIDQVEREKLTSVLRRHKGVVTHAAKELGVNRVTFYGLLKKHRLDAHAYKSI
ncbi:MAG: sigma-54-dependent transcriptional regulator [bacterium]